MEELNQLELEMQMVLLNIKRIREFKDSQEWIPCHSRVVGELKHRLVALKQTMTRASKVTTLGLFEE